MSTRMTISKADGARCSPVRQLLPRSRTVRVREVIVTGVRVVNPIDVSSVEYFVNGFNITNSLRNLGDANRANGETAPVSIRHVARSCRCRV
jgi:hypothetical protein